MYVRVPDRLVVVVYIYTLGKGMLVSYRSMSFKLVLHALL